ncbi:unnamed protein product [Rhizophagus irregularis]|nr:unnamed protein product [Rhizophagus irregularis]
MKPTQGTLYINDLDLEFSRVPDIHGLDTHVRIIYFSQHRNFIIFGSIFPVTFKFFPKNFARIKINVRSYSVENVRSL